MKRFFTLLLALLTLALPLSGCGESLEGSGSAQSDAMPNTVLMTVKDYGQVKIVLYPEIAPLTVSNFKGLVYKGYYDGLTFHRVIEGFMIQGGQGKKAPAIRGEFAENGIENTLKHERGVISMARTNDPNSASSQFFICQAPYPYGNGNYAAFGRVIEGMDVVDRIAVVATDYTDCPLSDVVIESIVFVEE